MVDEVKQDTQGQAPTPEQGGQPGAGTPQSSDNTQPAPGSGDDNTTVTGDALSGQAPSPIQGGQPGAATPADQSGADGSSATTLGTQEGAAAEPGAGDVTTPVPESDVSGVTSASDPTLHQVTDTTTVDGTISDANTGSMGQGPQPGAGAPASQQGADVGTAAPQASADQTGAAVDPASGALEVPQAPDGTPAPAPVGAGSDAPPALTTVDPVPVDVGAPVATADQTPVVSSPATIGDTTLNSDSGNAGTSAMPAATNEAATTVSADPLAQTSGAAVSPAQEVGNSSGVQTPTMDSGAGSTDSSATSVDTSAAPAASADPLTPPDAAPTPTPLPTDSGTVAPTPDSGSTSSDGGAANSTPPVSDSTGGVPDAGEPGGSAAAPGAGTDTSSGAPAVQIPDAPEPTPVVEPDPIPEPEIDPVVSDEDLAASGEALQTIADLFTGASVAAQAFKQIGSLSQAVKERTAKIADLDNQAAHRQAQLDALANDVVKAREYAQSIILDASSQADHLLDGAKSQASAQFLSAQTDADRLRAQGVSDYQTQMAQIEAYKTSALTDVTNEQAKLDGLRAENTWLTNENAALQTKLDNARAQLKQILGE